MRRQRAFFRWMHALRGLLTPCAVLHACACLSIDIGATHGPTHSVGLVDDQTVYNCATCSRRCSHAGANAAWTSAHHSSDGLAKRFAHASTAVARRMNWVMMRQRWEAAFLAPWILSFRNTFTTNRKRNIPLAWHNQADTLSWCCRSEGVADGAHTDAAG
jgi:hypothetical protein